MTMNAQFFGVSKVIFDRIANRLACHGTSWSCQSGVAFASLAMRAQRAVSLATSLPKAAWFSLVTASAPPFLQARDDVRIGHHFLDHREEPVDDFTRRAGRHEKSPAMTRRTSAG